MALVKKLQNGSKLPQNTTKDQEFDNFAIDIMKNVKKNSQKTFLDAIEPLRELYKKEGVEGLKNAFEFDPVARTYKTNNPNYNEFLGVEEGKKVKANPVGLYKLNTPEEARTYIMGNLYDKFLSKAETVSKTAEPIVTTPKGFYKNPIENIEQAITRDIYHNDQNLSNSKWSELLNPDREKIIKEIAPKVISKYLTDYEQNKGIEARDYSDVSTAQELQNILTSGKYDQNKFNELTTKLGWNISGLMISPEKLKQQEEEDSTLKKQQEEEDAIKSGIPADAAASGWRPTKNNAFDNYKNYFASKNLKLVDINGVTKLIDSNNQLVNPTFISDNPLSNLYGYGFENTESGLKVYDNKPNQPYSEEAKKILEQIKSEDFKPEIYDENQQIGLGTGINRKLYYLPISNIFQNPGKHNVISQRNGLDIFGRQNFFKNNAVGVQNSNGTVNWGSLQKSADGNYSLISKSGEKINLGKLKENLDLSKEINSSTLNVRDKSKFLNLPATYGVIPPLSEKSESGAINYINKTASELSDPVNHAVNMTNILAVIRDYPNIIAKINPEAYKNINEYYNSNLLGKKEYTSKINPNKINHSIKNITSNNYSFRHKKGGVLKYQYGGNTLKYTAPETKIENLDKKEIKPIDPNKTYFGDKGIKRTSDAASKLSTALNLASLAPGFIGSAAATGATIAEIVRDSQDAEGYTLGDFGNTLVNVGLIGASFLGLGALRGIKGVAKVGKELDNLNDIRKLAKETKVFEGYKDIKETAKTVQTFADTNKEIKSVSELRKIAEEAKELNVVKSIDKLNEFSKAKPSLLKHIIPGNKTISALSTTAMVGNAAMSIPGGVNAIKNFAEGWNNAEGTGESKINNALSNLSTDDVNSLAAIAFGSKIIGRQALNKAAINLTSIKGKAIPNKLTASVKLGDSPAKEISISVPKGKKSDYRKAIAEEYNRNNETKISSDDIKKFITKPTIIKGDKTPRTFLSNESYDPTKPVSIQNWAKNWVKQHGLTSEPGGVIWDSRSKRIEKTPVKTTETIKTEPVKNSNYEATSPVEKGLIEIKSESPIIIKSKPKVSEKTVIKRKNIIKKNAKKNKLASIKYMEQRKINKNKFGGILKAQNGGLLKAKKLLNPLSIAPISSSIPKLSTVPKISNNTNSSFDYSNKFSTFLGNSWKGVSSGINKGINYLKENPDLLATGLDYIETLGVNEKNAKLQKESLVNSLLKPELVQQPNIRITKTINPEAIKASSQYRILGKNIAGATSDWNKGVLARFAGEDKANNIMIGAESEAAKQTENQTRIADDMRYKINLANASSVSKTNAYNKGILSKIPLIDVNKNLANLESNRRLKQIGVNLITKNNYLNKTKNIMEGYENPDYLNNYKLYNTLITKPSDEYTLNKLFPADYSIYKKEAGINAKPEGFWESAQGKAHLEQIPKLQEFINNWRQDLQKKQIMLNQGISYNTSINNNTNNDLSTVLAQILSKNNSTQSYAKGGSISTEEKIVIEKEKSNNRIKLEQLKEYYKRLLKSEEFLQKAMIKIFK